MYLAELAKSQWSGPTEIMRLQQKRLEYLVRHAYQTVPYYHEIFRKNNLKPDDIKTSEDLGKLPILTRNEVRERFNALISRGYPKEKMVYGLSGGSTGEPIKFYTTKENREWNMAARYLFWRWAGFELGDKFAHVVGSPLDRPFFKSVRGRIEGKMKRRIYLDAFRMSERTMESFANEMRRFRPKVVYGYAKSVALLAKFIEEKGIEGIHLKSAIIDSEGLLEHEIETIKRVFGCDIWWSYHNRENGTFGAECCKHDAYHLFVQNHVLEFLREGERVAPGEAGSIVVTDLTNYAMPFIRYEIGDFGVPSGQMCTCGRGFPLMRKLVGRTSEVLVSATGKFMFGDLFHLYTRFYDIANIKQYQIVQESPTKVVVSIIPETDYTSRDTEIIKKGIFSIMGEMDVEINLVEKIPPSGSGKVQAVLRKFPIKFT
jgi:phenylacetate-CoA ligase